MQEKCKTLRLKIIEFRIMVPCNMMGGHRGFGLDLLPPSYDSLWR